ncbi:MAG: DUF3500 domain-containing protein [Marmoricola sp.]
MTSNSPLTDRPVSRRWLLTTVPVAAIAIAGCGTSSSTSGTTPAASTSATASWAAAAGSVAALAQAFYTTLSTTQKTTVLQDYSLANAVRWSNLPQGLLTGGMGGGGQQSRIGLDLGDLSGGQLTSFMTLLQAATGTAKGQGYDAINQLLNADDYLAANGGGDSYGRGNYYVALLGSPQDKGTWEFQFGGHHMAVANTYVDGTLVGATPSFRGVEPNGKFTQNSQVNQPMAVKEAALGALLAGLSTDQLSRAKLSDVFTDLVLTPGQDWKFPTTREGVQVSTFSAAQKKLVLAGIASYVNDIADADATKILATYRNELDDTYVAYSGSTSLTEQNDYIRIDGPSVWIEFSMQHGIVLSGNHPHSVWRDRKTDYAGTKA